VFASNAPCGVAVALLSTSTKHIGKASIGYVARRPSEAEGGEHESSFRSGNGPAWWGSVADVPPDVSDGGQ
jgi:hypothetical protein